jgi:hypothetical protein
MLICVTTTQYLNETWNPFLVIACTCVQFLVPAVLSIDCTLRASWIKVNQGYTQPSFWLEPLGKHYSHANTAICISGSPYNGILLTAFWYEHKFLISHALTTYPHPFSRIIFQLLIINLSQFDFTVVQCHSVFSSCYFFKLEMSVHRQSNCNPRLDRM